MVGKSTIQARPLSPGFLLSDFSSSSAGASSRWRRKDRLYFERRIRKSLTYQFCPWKVSPCYHPDFLTKVGNSLIGFKWITRFFVKKWVNRSFAKKTSNLLIRSFLVSNLSDSLTVAHFWWAPGAICSQLLFCHEQPERFPHISL